MTSDAPATLEIVAEPPALMLFARLVKVSIDIDGALARVRWGTNAFAVAPGEHVVAVGSGYNFNSKGVLTVSVAAGETVRLRYTPHFIKNFRGKLVVERLPEMRIVKR
ncbi:MAG: hypothetical protein H0V17_03410 [Deltaproteobacteria bacterium]|nr:hypothetical protein [Deltaproteobacteria bacterium]